MEKTEDRKRRLLRYIEDYDEDSQVVDAAHLLGISIEEVVEIAKMLPGKVVPKTFLRAIHPRSEAHVTLKERAIEWVKAKDLRAAREVKIDHYSFDVIGLSPDKTDRIVAVECGKITNKLGLYDAISSFSNVYHWPFGEEEPHLLGGCKGCMPFVQKTPRTRKSPEERATAQADRKRREKENRARQRQSLNEKKTQKRLSGVKLKIRPVSPANCLKL